MPCIFWPGFTGVVIASRMIMCGFFYDKQLGLHKWEERMNVSANVPLINTLFYFQLPPVNAEAIMLLVSPAGENERL